MSKKKVNLSLLFLRLIAFCNQSGKKSRIFVFSYRWMTHITETNDCVSPDNILVDINIYHCHVCRSRRNKLNSG